MRFWDSSALLAVVLEEERTLAMRALLDQDADIVASAVTAIEIESAIWRRRHRGELTVAAHQDAETKFARLSRGWIEVTFSARVSEGARRLLARQRLRSLDAIQLASAGLYPHGILPFVTLDEKLALAARSEGFVVLP